MAGMASNISWMSGGDAHVDAPVAIFRWAPSGQAAICDQSERYDRSFRSCQSCIAKLTIYSIESMDGSAIRMKRIDQIVVNLSKSAIYSIELCAFGPTHVAGGCVSNLVADMGQLESTHWGMSSGWIYQRHPTRRSRFSQSFPVRLLTLERDTSSQNVPSC
jgi:hypothetical protein